MHANGSTFISLFFTKSNHPACLFSSTFFLFHELIFVEHGIMGNSESKCISVEVATILVLQTALLHGSARFQFIHIDEFYIVSVRLDFKIIPP